MISFPCNCKAQTFSLPDSEAGGLIQCPKCGRLNDIPTLDELKSYDSDGSLKIEPAHKRKKTSVNELHRTYSNETTDDFGNEVDLRQTVDDLRTVGSKERAVTGKVKPEKPRYDPLSGELVRPLDIKPPVAKKSTLISAADIGASSTADALDRNRRKNAASRLADSAHPIPTLYTLPLRLLEPINMLMIGFASVGLAIFALACMPLLAGLFFAAPVPIIVGALVVAHYANCVEDLGPGEENDVPRFLRDAEFHGDIWKPFVRMSFSLGLCFAPAMIFALKTGGAIQFIGSGTLLMLGALAFPAVALVFCASQHVANLRPDRLLGTIVVLGGQYIPTLVLALTAVILHVAACFALLIASASLFGTDRTYLGWWWLAAGISTPLAVYVGHLAAWWLGILYRRNEGHFPWVFEMHERARMEHKRLKVLAELEKNRQRAAP